MVETPSSGRARRTPPNDATASPCGWPLPLGQVGGDPLATGSYGSEPRRETSDPRRGGARRARGTSEPHGGEVRSGGVLGPLYAVGGAVRPVSRGGSVASVERRTRA